MDEQKKDDGAMTGDENATPMSTPSTDMPESDSEEKKPEAPASE